MTEVLHSSSSMPISSVSHTMKRLVEEMDYPTTGPLHSSPVDLLTQYAMGSPLAKKQRLNDNLSVTMNSPDAQSDEQPLSSPVSSKDTEDVRVLPQNDDEIYPEPAYHTDDLPEEAEEDKNESNICYDSDDLSDEVKETTPVRSFPCVWLNSDGTERVESPGIVAIEPEDAEDEMPRSPEDVAPIVVVPENEQLTPVPRPFPCVWMDGNNIEDRPKSPIAMCLPSTPDSKVGTPPLLKFGSVPTPEKLIKGGALNILPTRLPIPGHSPPRPPLIPVGGFLPNPLLTPENGDDTQPMEVCPECNKVFKRKVYLQRHMEREHWSTAKIFKCTDCAYETKHQSNLSVHRRIHTGRSIIPLRYGELL